ncbi:MAG: 16S rRNA (cytosine(967)-C(5))-methyltransferase RsmB [Pseudomonadota bacterium]
MSGRAIKAGVAVRVAAANAIQAVVDGRSLDAALNEIALESVEDVGLLRELTYGSLRQWPRLEGIVDQLLTKPLRRKDRLVRTLVILGLYQLSGMRVPAHAAIDTTVEAASALKKRPFKGLVNALLRRYQREAQALESGLSEAQVAAHPKWLYDALRTHYPEQLEQLCRANNARPPMCLRVNLSKCSRDKYQSLLQEQGTGSQLGDYAPSALTLNESLDVAMLPGFEAGLCSVQDEAAQLAAKLLAPRAGERVLDACAAPGGKAAHCLELSPDTDLVVSDISEHRMERVKENLDRLGLRATQLTGDAANPDHRLAEQAPFDAIMLDAPCSASGVIRRHPDVKLLRRPDDIAQFAKQQLALLRGLWPLLASEGRLLYITCSILPPENEQIVERFLASEASAWEQEIKIPGALRRCVGGQLLPCEDGTDGLYYCMLRKREA